MLQDLKSKDFSSLLDLYNQETEALSKGLLNGETWESLADTRKNITQLCIILQKEHNYIVTAHPAKPVLHPSTSTPAV